ncbi:type I-E CRISPR-associated protein Cse2/CasB [Myxococcota bacterium]|nr:type I-E CRISPR-associated protein Cse2/CasB [Myxococcota bacterium]MBU1900385.1 type I-E CRISPR-associated protein Cse2/CasB [Myxococcota bacterium]
MTIYETATKLAWGITQGDAGPFSKAELAELRRMNPDSPGGIAFWRTFHRLINPEGDPSSAASERAWMILLSGMAHHAMHNDGMPLGQALFAAGVSEQRFVKLLEARDEALLDQVLVTARYLRAKNQPMNWGEMARLVFDDRPELRQRIAKSYFHAENSSHKKEESK